MSLLLLGVRARARACGRCSKVYTLIFQSGWVGGAPSISMEPTLSILDRCGVETTRAPPDNVKRPYRLPQ